MIMNIATLCINCKKNSSCTMCWKTSDKKCPHFIQKTNADRIRAMNDEELADVVANGVGCVLKAPHCMDVDCTPCILKWLKQPFEGE